MCRWTFASALCLATAGWLAAGALAAEPRSTAEPARQPLASPQPWPKPAGVKGQKSRGSAARGSSLPRTAKTTTTTTAGVTAPRGRTLAPRGAVRLVQHEEASATEGELPGQTKLEEASFELEDVPRFEDDVQELPEWPHRVERTRIPLPAAAEEEDEACERRDGAPVNRLAQAGPDDVEPTIEPEPVEGETPGQRHLRKLLVRPFKKMNDIRPFYDYEPDGEVSKEDRCFNLCPRPGGLDCPDCDPSDGEIAEGRLACPECPTEMDLRESSQYTGQVVDFPVRNFPHIHYCWEPTNLHALPLYFEDPCLERYGHTRHYLLQPIFSTALFTAQFVGLPYQMSIDPIWKRRYALGYYRPGQYVPYKYYQVPWNTQAAITEAAVLVGAFYLFAPDLGP